MLRRRPLSAAGLGVRPAEVEPQAPPSDARVHLRVLARADRDEFLALARDSRELHRPWTYPPERADQFDDLFARSRRDDFVCLVACVNDSNEIAGVFTVSQIVRGAFQSAYLGYYAHARHSRQGLMREAVEEVPDPSFGPQARDRLEANIRPGNQPSIALARGAGFRLEGFSPRYLLIGGQWRDHERYAITVDERAAQKSPS